MKSYPKVIDRILEVIRENKTFCIVGHMRPDGDCIGSQLGLALALRNEGKKVTVWNQDSIPLKYKFLVGCYIRIEYNTWKRDGNVHNH